MITNTSPATQNPPSLVFNLFKTEEDCQKFVSDFIKEEQEYDLDYLNLHFELDTDTNKIHFNFKTLNFESNDYFDVFDIIDEVGDARAYPSDFYSDIKSTAKSLDSEFNTQREIDEEIQKFKIEHHFSDASLTIQCFTDIDEDNDFEGSLYNSLSEALKQIYEESFITYLHTFEVFNNTVDDVVSDLEDEEDDDEDFKDEDDEDFEDEDFNENEKEEK